MTEIVAGIAAIALAFMAVAVVQIRAGCGRDCGSCDRPCKALESTDGQDETH